MTRAVVIMGPSGCGKTTLARELAAQLQWPFIEGDELHPPSNRRKMAAGEPLTDADRAPWLASIAATIAATSAPGVVVACSALKRRYRDVLRMSGETVTFVLPSLTREALADRLARRTGHFMPPSLLESQLATLEPPDVDEDGFTVDGTAEPVEQVTRIRSKLAP